MWFLLLACAVGRSALASAENGLNIVERPDDELVLVDLRLERQTLSEALTAYLDKNRLFLPLGQFAQALQFPITVHPKDGQAEGWLHDQNRLFTLDVPRREVVIEGSRADFAAGAVELHTDDIYIDSALLAQWFSLDLNFSFAEQSVSITPKPGVKLPAQLAAEREKARDRLRFQSGEPQKAVADYPRIAAPYRLASMPFGDLNLNAGYDSRDGRNVIAGGSALVTGDLFYMNNGFFVAADEKGGVRDMRWSLSRRDQEGRLFAPDEAVGRSSIGHASRALGLSEFIAGDVFTAQLPLTAQNQSGRGVMLGNMPLERMAQFDRTTLQGDLLPGWQVELYRNDELLNFQRASANGRYEFIDVPLLSGLNVLRLVFYGPSGETREEVQRYLATPDITQPGKSYFRLAAVQQQIRVFDVGGMLDAPSRATLVQDVQDQQRTEGRERLLAEYEYGVARNLALFGSLARLPGGDGALHNYMTGGLAATLAGTYARLDASHDAGGGNAVQATLQGSALGATFSGQHRQFFDFLSDYTQSSRDPLISHTALRADAPLKLPLLPRFNAGFSGERFTQDSGRTRDEIANRLSASFGSASLSHALRWSADRVPATGTARTLEGEWLVSAPVAPRLIVRGNALYRITPARELDTAALTGEYALSESVAFRLDIDKQFTSNLTTYTAEINRRFEQFLLGLSTAYADNGEFAVGLSLSLSIGQEPRSGQMRLYPGASARDGLISARAFLDKNHDGVFNEGDAPLPGARFLVGGGSTPDAAPDLLRNIAPGALTGIALDESSLENPYWVSKTPGYALVPRAGTPVQVDFPVTGTGEIEGTVYRIREDGARQEAANVQLELIDEKGVNFLETKTAFDGFYLLERVPPGDYTLRVSPGQCERLGLRASPPRFVRIKGEDDIAKGNHFELRAVQPASAVAIQPESAAIPQADAPKF